MKSLAKFINKVFVGNDTVYNSWERARRDAAKFGPSHVAEIDAIFSRHI